MYTEFDYLNVDILNDIEQKMQALYQKYSAFTSQTYIEKIWQEGELVYNDEIANIESSLEYLGAGFGYPEGWMKSRNWNVSESSNISYKDINRLLNNIEILDKGNFNPLFPSDTLCPRDTLYPTNYRLPKEYTQVDYIESTGTQYIYTEIKGNLSTEIIAKVTKTNSSGAQLFGDITSQSNAISCNFSTDSALTSRFGNKQVSINFGNYITLNSIFEVKENKDGIYINSEKVANFNTIDDFTTDKGLMLFTRNSSGGFSSYWKGRLYSFKIYRDGVLKRDFIPCYRNSDKELGLYDIANNKFYTNQGTGKFICGGE